TDHIDEFWVPTVGTYDKKAFKSVAEAGTDLADIKDGDDKADDKKDDGAEESIKAIVEKLKGTLGEAVADVRVSHRLTGSPVCLVADAGGMSLHLARMLKQHGEAPGAALRKVLEI